ncbi:MAG: hypothetical protein M3131_04400 [Actinomycetota bacterium]|nr:hypothetical protein [Actinomycetota bacterium]
MARWLATEAAGAAALRSAVAARRSPGQLRGDASVESSASGALLQRLCSPPLTVNECKRHKGTQDFAVRAVAKPANRAKVEKRQKLCDQAGHQACTSDGHHAEATELMAFARERAPERLKRVAGIFVDKDIPREYGAHTGECSQFVPPIAVWRVPSSPPRIECVLVPDWMESQAKQFNAGDLEILGHPVLGKMSRSQWEASTLETIWHETGHARFWSSPMQELATSSCSDKAAVDFELSELEAMISTFPLCVRRAQSLPSAKRQASIDDWFKQNMTARDQSIQAALKAVCCRCSDDDADRLVKKLVEDATASWTTLEQFLFNWKLKYEKKWKLKWPVDPPAVNVSDLWDAEELPEATQ